MAQSSAEWLGSPALPWTTEPPPPPPPLALLFPLLEGPESLEDRSTILSETSMWPPGDCPEQSVSPAAEPQPAGGMCLVPFHCPYWYYPSWPSGAELAVDITFAGDN